MGNGLSNPVTDDLVFSRNLRAQTVRLVLDNLALACKQLIQSGPFTIDVLHVKPVAGELVPLAGERGLALPEQVNLRLPYLCLPLALLDNRDKRHCVRSRGCFQGLPFQIPTCRGNVGVDFPHAASEFGAKLEEYLMLPLVIFGINSCLDLLVVNLDVAKRTADFRCIERSTALPDLLK